MRAGCGALEDTLDCGHHRAHAEEEVVDDVSFRALSANAPFPLRTRRAYAPIMTASPVNTAQSVRLTCTRLTACEFAYRTRCVPVRSHAFPV